MFITVIKFYGIGGLYDIQEITYEDNIIERTIFSNVNDFELKGSFLFASKRHVSLTTSYTAGGRRLYGSVLGSS